MPQMGVPVALRAVCGSASSAAIDPGVVGWWAWGVGGSAVFVGRDRELARLRAVVGGGEARLLLVVGDAGVGKTRLVTQAMSRVAADGTLVVWGGCLPMRETLPLLPVVDALSELGRIDRGEPLESNPLCGSEVVTIVELRRTAGWMPRYSASPFRYGPASRVWSAAVIWSGVSGSRCR